MSFSFTIEGAVPSGNHAYHIVRIKRPSGTILTMAKTREAEAWQVGATYIARLARPSGWAPTGYIRIYYSFILTREIDVSDNAQKLLNDALKNAWGIDDKMFLTCVRSKSVHKTNQSRVIVEVEDA